MFTRLEHRPRSRFPWVTSLLVALCLGSFTIFSLATPAEWARLVQTWGVVPGVLFAGDGSLLRFLQPLTALFVHVDWLHLVGNMLFLVIFGVPTERAMDRGFYAGLFLLAGTAANLAGAWSIAASTDMVIVGCSGAVSAIMGAYLALFPRASLGIVLPLGLYFEFVRVPALLLIGLWVALQLLFSWAGPSVGAVVWWAHIAGFAFGLVAAVLLRPVLARRRRMRA